MIESSAAEAIPTSPAPNCGQWDFPFVVFAWSVFLLSLFFCCWALTVGWNNPLLDMHSFRQTQTAISVFFMNRGGPWLDYETPVLGAPWSCPYEFPLYQWMVLGIHRLGGVPLDQSGRLISILFLLFGFAAVYRLMCKLEFSRPERLISMSIFMLSPHYLFWGRTFMIETTALALGFWYAVLSTEFLHDAFAGRQVLRRCYSFALLAGVLGGLVKVTTFLIFPPLAFCLAGFLLARDGLLSLRLCSHKNLRLLIAAAALLVVPIVISALWTAHTDALKEQIPFAHFITSKALMSWHFGTLQQRLSWDDWERWIFGRAVPDIGGHYWVAWIFAYLFVLPLPWMAWSAFWLLVFFIPPLVFVNLYFVHNYYQSANGFFLLFAIASIVVGLARGGNRALSMMLTVLLMTLAMQGYIRGYYPWTVEVGGSHLAAAKRLQALTRPEDVIVVYGDDWSSEIPYYAERRAVMDREFRALDHPAMQETIKLSAGKAGFGAIIACGDILRFPDPLGKRVSGLGFDPGKFEELSGCRIWAVKQAAAQE